MKFARFTTEFDQDIIVNPKEVLMVVEDRVNRAVCVLSLRELSNRQDIRVAVKGTLDDVESKLNACLS